MLVNWLRENKYAAAVLLFVRLYLGYEWLTHGWEKLMGNFNAGGFLNNAVNNPVIDKATNELIYPTFTAFVTNFALPNVKIINFLIPLGEFLVGLGLILGAFTTAAAFCGLLMNFMFMFAGTVSTNPWFILIGGILFLGGANTGKFGVDHYLLPLLRHVLTHKKEGTKNKPTGTIRPRHI
ncbi:DoxX family protein [Paenibacillus sp. GCM10023248]|uniref:DoxX family protein n=1 Tax=Bacillales TaxID=1385 RepID=UPI0023798675|nr:MULTISPECIES: DoxX family protein [Bacillales]MDD9266766.1 DoxX family protein [Paenibacillus sp. MAHUQ-63]MDR6883711.1 thiosulfate dehydrogenase [quinone] large subunit [Bacillus sp. 3255]